MNQNTDYSPCWVRGGEIEEIIWFGGDMLAWCSGLYIVFFDVVKKLQTLRWCWNYATGDGARCVCGHITLPVFAFSERSLNPRILVFAYPSMARICECIGGCNSGYLAIAFTPDDYLVSLGSYPNFPMIIWHWRTGEKVLLVDTLLRDDVGQIIRVPWTGRTVIAQMGKTCGKLFTWELDVVDKLVILKDHKIKLPNESEIRGIDWCPSTPDDPLLAITDKVGHVYLCDYDGTNVRRVIFSQHCGVCVDWEIPIVCWFRDDIILKTTFCQIRYYKKESTSDVWRKQWYVKSDYKPNILIAHPSKSWLFYYTLEGCLVQMVLSKDKSLTPTSYKYLKHGNRYRFVDFVYPWCHHLVATDDLKKLTVLESYSGSEISEVELDIEGNISTQAAHPDDPLIVLVSDQGEVIILGMTDPEKSKILAYFRLQRDSLDLIKFSHCGKFLIAAQKGAGNCYCVSLQRDEPWKVMARLQAKGRIVDVALYDDETCGSLKVLVLHVDYEPFHSVGRQLLVYDVPYAVAGRRLINEIAGIVALPALSYELFYAPGDSRTLISSVYLERQLHTLRVRRHFEDATLTDVTLTGHHVRLARVFADRRWIVTCAYDGLVVIRDKTIRKIVTVVPAHHRLDLGSRKAIVNPGGDMMIALGHDGSLIATRICRGNEKKNKASLSAIETKSVYTVDSECHVNRKEKILTDYASLDPAIRASLTRDRVDLPAAGETGLGTWEEWRQNAQLREEARVYTVEKAAIAKSLEPLKATVKQLLDANEACPEMEALPLSAFDLDKAGRERRLKTAEEERENTRMELEHLCASMDRVASWMKTTFWDPQVVLGRSIFSFRGDIEVTNYPLTEEDPYFKEHLRWAQFARDFMHSIVHDTFQPWRSYTDDQLQKELSKPVRVYREDERRRMELLLEEEERETDPDELTELRAVDGMTTHRFVEQSSYFYSQMESYGFAHVILDDRYLMHDYNKLHAYFNELFDNMHVAKEQEINVIREGIERIRYIDSELKIMFGRGVPRIPVDPQWHPKEKVLESIVRVLDHEVKAKPYVSPLQQEILNEQAAEAERIRQLALADDFREHALKRMMDGMLEIRWEDVIKVDVRMPECMVHKLPEKYTSDDIAAIKKYEIDTEALQQERERYRRMLEADYAKINGFLNECIDKFDAKLNEFFQLKLRIEAAINQLRLRHIRGRVRILARIDDVKKDDEIKREIYEKCRYQNTLEEHRQKLHDIYQDMLAQHDILCIREKAMAKKLQQELAGMSKVNIELLERQFKRRPRASLKNIAASDLLSLAKYLVDGVQPAYFPIECAEYLKILEELDARPGELPQSIDSGHWDRLTQSRRHKINIELQIKAREFEIAAAERKIAAFESKIDACRSSAVLLRDRLRTAREERIMCERNAEVQLVLKKGQVELKLRGERHDAADAVLIPREEIVRVNEHICVEGERKLDALKHAIDFRRGMLSIKWEHRCLRMKFKELKEDLEFVNNITITREMSTYLKRKAKGLRDNKTAVQLEREIEGARKFLDEALSAETKKLENLRQRITRAKKENTELDQAITEMSAARWELEHQRDVIGKIKQREHIDRKMRLFRQRSNLIRKLQDNYTELLVLQTERELLWLRNYPALQCFRTLESKDEGCK